MAKRKKKAKEEEYEFKAPEFDEEEFLKKEVRDARAAFITIGYAVLIAVFSFLLVFADVFLSILLGLLAVVFLRHIYPALGVDTVSFEYKNWLGNIVMYFFTWLAIWMLLMNPPISDFSKPNFVDTDRYVGIPGDWVELNDTTKPLLDQDMNLSIAVKITDNSGIDKNSVRIRIEHNESVITDPEWSSMSEYNDDRYYYTISNALISEGLYEFNITVKDLSGNKARLNDKFMI